MLVVDEGGVVLGGFLLVCVGFLLGDFDLL